MVVPLPTLLGIHCSMVLHTWGHKTARAPYTSENLMTTRTPCPAHLLILNCMNNCDWELVEAHCSRVETRKGWGNGVDPEASHTHPHKQTNTEKPFLLSSFLSSSSPSCVLAPFSPLSPSLLSFSSSFSFSCLFLKMGSCYATQAVLNSWSIFINFFLCVRFKGMHHHVWLISKY